MNLKESLGSVLEVQLHFEMFPENNGFKNVAHDFFMISHVPLHNFGAFEFRSKIIGETIFRHKFCGGIPGKSNEFKNSTG